MLLDQNPSVLNVAIITTASPLKEQNPFAQKAREDLIRMGFIDVTFIDIEHEDPSLLFDKDVVYISGGNPFVLLTHMRTIRADQFFEKILENGVVIIGVSAGAVILGPNIEIVQHFTPAMNTLKLEDLTGLGLADHFILPHYHREDIFSDESGKTIEERIPEFEINHNCSVVRLKDDDDFIISKF